jgi:multiple sugar transport system substrate-binding protein
MKKRVLSVFMGAAMVMSMLMGCGSTAGTTGGSGAGESATPSGAAGTSEGGNSAAAASTVPDVNDDGTYNNPLAASVPDGNLTFWSLFSGGDGEWFNSIVDDYNKTQNPTNPVTPIMLVWADYYTKLQTAVATGNGPDVGVSHVSKLYELAETGVVKPLDDYLNKLGINLSDYYSKESIDSVTIDGHIYAIPLDTHAEVMYYNLDLLKKAGITEDDVKNIKSKDDFAALLKKCKSLGDDITPLAMTNSADDPFRIWYADYFQMGGTDFVNDGATEDTLDVDKAKAAMEYVKSLWDDGYILPGIDDHTAYFQSGKAAFLFAGTWVTGTLSNTDGLNYNNACYPSLFDGNQQCWADSHTLILPVNDKRTEDETLQAVKFMFYASNNGGITWAGSGQIPAAKAANESADYKKLKGYNVVNELQFAKYAPKATQYYGGIKADMIDALNGYWQGTTDEDTAIAALKQAIDNNLD